ncbi:hypothetical protein CLOP_g23328 [Closterium sp. NIES-67]|nr:hypothetical protein CLOP_g23328 [Closterium sp. NIES-67]
MEPQRAFTFLIAFLLPCLVVATAVDVSKKLYAGQEGSAFGACPSFGCKPGAHVSGMFTDSDSEDIEYMFKYSMPFMFNDTDSPAWDPLLTDPFYDCWKVCSDYNKENPSDAVTYWQYEETCDIGGVCACFDEGVCTLEHFNPDGTIDVFTDSTGDYHPESRFYVGKICDSNVTGDPHFVGADKSRFDFSGIPNENFALITDSHVQVNAFFGGRWARWMDSERKALTWMRKIAILWGHHSIIFEAREGPDPKYRKGYLSSLIVDGVVKKLRFPGEKLHLFDGQGEVKWLAGAKPSGGDLVDEYEVTVADVLSLRLTLRPEIEMMRTIEDGLVHFTVEVLSARLSANVHGVLGQTYRPDFAGRLEKQTMVYSKLFNAYVVPGDNAEGFIDGTVEDYQVSSLLHTDCDLCRFIRARSLDDETARAVELSTTVASSFTALGRRAAN